LKLQRNNENNVSKACILMAFEKIWKKILKAMNLNGAFSRYLIGYFNLQRKF